MKKIVTNYQLRVHHITYQAYFIIFNFSWCKDGGSQKSSLFKGLACAHLGPFVCKPDMLGGSKFV